MIALTEEQAYTRLDAISTEERKTLFLEVLASEKAACETSYYQFILSSHNVIEPQTIFEDNWHIKYLCDMLQAEILRIAQKKPKTRDIIINIVPRSLKSRICTVCLAPWAWGPGNMPYLKFINNSHNKELSVGHCLESRRIIESNWYQMFWGNRFELVTDQSTKSWFENDHRGMRRATSTGSGIYGAGADVIISDDPQDPEKGESEVERETVKRHYGQTLYSRINDQRTGLRLIIQQRLHEDDLTGYLMKTDPEQYKHICIPAEITDDVSPKELRKYYKNGLFFPTRFSRDLLNISRLPTNLGEYGYAGQMLQRPAPPGGGTFKNTWWRFWQYPGMDLTPPVFKNNANEDIPSQLITLPSHMEQIVDSWDTAMDGEITRDDVAGQKWAKIGANKYLLNEKIGKFDYPETKKMVKALYAENSHTTNVLIERSANGPAVKADLEAEVPGIITIPTGRKSKEDRVKMSDTVPYQAQAQAGNIYLPHPQIAPWVLGFIEEHGNFPKSAQDGQVDSAAQAVNFLTTKKYVWPYFQTTNPAIYRNFQLRWDSYYHYGAVVIQKDLSIHILTAVWDRTIRKLYVYGELIASEFTAASIARKIVVGMNFKGRTVHGLYGNPEIFKPGKNTVEVLNTEIVKAAKLQEATKLAVIREASLYDPAGSIGLTNLMFSNGSIVVHEDCREAARQIASWTIDDDKPADGFGLCEALCIIVGELNQTIKKEKKKKWEDPNYKPRRKEKPVREQLNSYQIA